jgi:hypothetical protein
MATMLPTRATRRSNHGRPLNSVERDLLVRWVASEFKELVDEAESLQHAWFALRKIAVDHSRAERHHARQVLGR